MKTTWQSLRMLAVLSILTGLLYPLLMTGLAQALFPDESNGSLIRVNGQVIGSELVGQSFASEKYFWSRPSATGYSALPSSGTNQGPTSATLRDSVAARAARFGAPATEIPADLLHASGSGLDPHISSEAATYQIDRVLAARGMATSQRKILEQLVEKHTEPPQLGLFGDTRVNVVRLNLALDSLVPG